jgi:D-arabinose 1-dehydrogenase-like Zn-dependent alcohol dehydrogenase
MSKMRVVQVTRPNGSFEIVEREIPEPGAGQVRIKVEACGICHSDAMTKEGLSAGIQYPRVPGHEVAGIIDEVAEGVAGWTEGQRVGVGWHGGHCGYCESCRRGDFVTCQVALQVPGIAYDGGYASASRRLEFLSCHGAPISSQPFCGFGLGCRKRTRTSTCRAWVGSC